jgi:hypothetical protein
METNKLLLNSQCGFRKGLSTMDILLRLEHLVRDALVNKQTCLVLYLDLTSAFDKVNHTFLIHKLVKLGVKGNLLRWIVNYLSDRKMCIRIGRQY